mmetsp:Transcript_50809/g.99604  ORF Transcript_50809/g.99604 Transcript_50809/m.99604 type:complete len:204 (+) Transcript_50809:53-664(+)|eukprot:CAMPEP_0175140610 /NCGR_PEP_ID=MMETSP0087-20121206/11615_1 /TAXON_ID=136419 /ORGANISM="Unknown Unknown, Strain D1" /LENGTH=203 /DNA_ID=CAMNT_0016423873 /DNA_START=55 /DNA_END=666 /DNA_ORIENTATION=+
MSSAFNVIPAGFFLANEALNAFPAGVVTQMVSEIVAVMSQRIGEVDANKYHKILKSEGHQCQPEQVSSAINALTFVFRNLIAAAAAPDAVEGLLKKHADLSPAVVGVVVEAWTRNSKDGAIVTGAEQLGRTLRLGQLVGFEWKLGVGVSSSNCKALNAPFVSVVLKVSDADGKVDHFPVELQLHEFQDFARTFRDISQQLESV